MPYREAAEGMNLSDADRARVFELADRLDAVEGRARTGAIAADPNLPRAAQPPTVAERVDLQRRYEDATLSGELLGQPRAAAPLSPFIDPAIGE